MEYSFGEYLRREREAREIGLDDIVKNTKIQKRILIALEANRLDQLPSLTFVRGFIRQYAQYIGLDPNQTLLRFEEYLKESHPELYGAKPAKKKPVKVLNIIIPVAIVLVIVGVVVLSIIGNRSQEVGGQTQTPHHPRTQPGATIPSTGSTVQTGQTAKPQPTPEVLPGGTYISPPFVVKVKAIEICWLLATIDERSSREATLYPGSSFETKVDQRLSLLLGNGGGTQITVNGVPLKQVGSHWKPARILIPDDLGKYLPEGYKFKPAGKTEEAKPGETTPTMPASQPGTTAKPATPAPAPGTTVKSAPKPAAANTTEKKPATETKPTEANTIEQKPAAEPRPAPKTGNTANEKKPAGETKPKPAAQADSLPDPEEKIEAPAKKLPPAKIVPETKKPAKKNPQ